MAKIPITVVEELKNTINRKKEIIMNEQAEKEKEQEAKKIASLPENVAKRELEKIDKDFNIRISNLLFRLNESINNERWNNNFEAEIHFPMDPATSDESTIIVISVLKKKIKIIPKEILEDVIVNIYYEKESIYEDDFDDIDWGSGKLLYTYNNIILKVSINFEEKQKK